jgi:hypothetical protein
VKVVPLEATELTLPDILELAKGQTVVLSRKGEPLASVKDLTGLDWEAVAQANNPHFQKLIAESRRSYAEEGGTSIGELRAELGLKPRSRRRIKKS